MADGQSVEKIGISEMYHPHTQPAYALVRSDQESRGINGPLFVRSVCGGANSNGSLFNSLSSLKVGPNSTGTEGGRYQKQPSFPLTPKDGFPSNESVYSILPPKSPEPPKKLFHRSKHDPKLPPTSSTFGLHGTSLPGVRNAEGRENRDTERGYDHRIRRDAASIGIITPRSIPAAFLKRHYGELNKSREKLLHESVGSRLSTPRDRSPRKPPIPAKWDVPPMGLRSEENFVNMNAINAILGRTDGLLQKSNGTLERVRRREYKEYGPHHGMIPGYLTKAKEELTDRNNKAQEQFSEQYKSVQATFPYLDEEERERMIEALKKRWDMINSKYQNITLALKCLDTRSRVVRKELYEQQMDQIEEDIRRLRKGNVRVNMLK